MTLDTISREIFIDAPPPTVWSIAPRPGAHGRLVQRRGRRRPSPRRVHGPTCTATDLPGGRPRGGAAHVRVRWLREGSDPAEDASTLVVMTLVPEGDPTLRVTEVASRAAVAGGGRPASSEQQGMDRGAGRASSLRRPGDRPDRVVIHPQVTGGDRFWSALADRCAAAARSPARARGHNRERACHELSNQSPGHRQAPRGARARRTRPGAARGREVRFAICHDQLEQAQRQMAQVAARWDQRLGSIKRIAEAAHQAAASAPEAAPHVRGRPKADPTLATAIFHRLEPLRRFQARDVARLRPHVWRVSPRRALARTRSAGCSCRGIA